MSTDEPLTINHNIVAEYLEQMRRPRMALLVRSLGGEAQAANRRAMDAIARCNELHRRLEQYEPPAGPRHEPQPPPEASD